MAVGVWPRRAQHRHRKPAAEAADPEEHDGREAGK